MDAKRAAEVLRSKESIQIMDHRTMARDMGAQALEAWAWVERKHLNPVPHGSQWALFGYAKDGEWFDVVGPTPLAAVLDAMEKEGKG